MKSQVNKFNNAGEYFFTEGCFINELSNSPGDPEVSIAQARLEPGKTTRWHYLQDITERYVILEGTGSVELGSNKPQLVKPGDTVLIPARTRQRITNTDTTELIFLAICTPRFEASHYVDDEDN